MNHKEHIQCIYIYTSRERERERELGIFLGVYKIGLFTQQIRFRQAYMCIYTHNVAKCEEITKKKQTKIIIIIINRFCPILSFFNLFNVSLGCIYAPFV